MANYIFLALAVCTGFSASATDLNSFLGRVCAEVPKQIAVTPQQCAGDARLSIEGSSKENWWRGSVIFVDPRGGASYTCEFRVRADDTMQVYLCERRVSQGE